MTSAEKNLKEVRAMDFNAIKAQFKVSQSDTGSAEVQIISLTEEIEGISKHLISNPKDLSSKIRGLSARVVTRKRLFKYLDRKSPKIARSLKDVLGIRK